MDVQTILRELDLDKQHKNKVQLGDRQVEIKSNSVSEKGSKGSWSFTKTKKGA